MIWGLDTETDHDGKSAWIVQWVIAGKTGIYKGTCLRTLVLRLRALGRTHEKQYIYIHNLAYDLQFIKYGLWQLKQEFGATVEPIFRKRQPIQITVKVNNRVLVFRDSAKKWQGNLRSLGDALGYPKLENIDPDFKPGWSEYLDLDSDEDWKYVIRDAMICAKAGEFWHGSGFKRATTSGDAWRDMKSLIGKTVWDAKFPPLTHEEDDKLRDGYFGGINISRNKGYHEGSITHDDKVSMYPGVMLDKPLPVGSPIYMGSEFPKDTKLWVGKMTVKLDLKPGHIPWFSFKNGVDYCGEDIGYGDHIEHTKVWHVLTLTSVDWENLREDYDIQIMEGPGEFWAFCSETGLLKPYIDKWAAEKNKWKKIKKSDNPPPDAEANYQHSKRMLNAAYGRFALIPDGEKTELVEEDGLIDWKTEPEEAEPTAYLPYAMFVTAWARRELMDRVRKIVSRYGTDSILHCDTDSVIYLGEPYGEYGEAIGQWDMESRPSAIYEGGFKRYIEVFNDKPFWDEKKKTISRYNVTCAGVPQPKRADGLPYGMWIELLDDPSKIFGGELGHDSYTIGSHWLRTLYWEHNRDPGNVNTLKLIPREVPGGVILEGRTHEIDSDGMIIRLSRSSA